MGKTLWLGAGGGGENTSRCFLNLPGAALALGSGKGVQDVPAAAVRSELAKGGSSVL